MRNHLESTVSYFPKVTSLGSSKTGIYSLNLKNRFQSLYDFLLLKVILRIIFSTLRHKANSLYLVVTVLVLAAAEQHRGGAWSHRMHELSEGENWERGTSCRENYEGYLRFSSSMRTRDPRSIHTSLENWVSWKPEKVIAKIWDISGSTCHVKFEKDKGIGTSQQTASYAEIPADWTTIHPAGNFPLLSFFLSFSHFSVQEIIIPTSKKTSLKIYSLSSPSSLLLPQFGKSLPTA